MESRAEKAYKVYKSCVAKKFKAIPRYDLNTLYNVTCRMKRDAKYAEEIAELKTAEGEPLDLLIEKYFNDYNNLYGLEIRDDLIEYENPEMACGSYFKIESFIYEGGELVKRLPTEFLAGETARVVATLYSHESGAPISAKKISLTGCTDDGEEIKKTFTDCSSFGFDLTLSRPGGLKFKIIVLDDNDKPLLGAELGYGGIVFSRKEITTTHRPPKDLKEFWSKKIDELLLVNPLETYPDAYTGKVQTRYNISERNFYRLIKVDTAYAEKLKSLGQPYPSAEDIEAFNIYEVNLKAPGPCPATAYVSVPKGAEKKSLPIHFIYDGYGVHMSAPVCVNEQISVHATHHGYELAQNTDYYKDLFATVCGHYCRGNGEVNSDCNDIHDCYPLYIMLRNLQMLRFLTSEKLSSGIELLHEKWNGNVTMYGGSMGGYQTVCVGALAAILRDKVGGFSLTKLDAPSPAFGNVAGSTDKRVTSTFFVYSEGADYFDTAILATLLDTKTNIPRASLGDEACPVTTMTAIYNSIPKEFRGEIRYIQNSSHGYLPDPEHQEWIVYND